METECCDVHTPWEVDARVKGSGRERKRRAYFQETGGIIK